MAPLPQKADHDLPLPSYWIHTPNTPENKVKGHWSEVNSKYKLFVKKAKVLSQNRRQFRKMNKLKFVDTDTIG